MDKITTIKQSAKSILTGNIESAKNLINKEYPFKKLKPEGRSYTDKEKYEQFVRDGFIDRYTGEKLVNPGLLKVLSYYSRMHFHIRAIGRWKNVTVPTGNWSQQLTTSFLLPLEERIIRLIMRQRLCFTIQLRVTGH